MAKEIKAGLVAGGVNVDLFQVPETLPKAVLDMMGAPAKPADIMTLTHDFVEKLPEYDGFIFGMPTRFGGPCGQMKMFLDSLGGLWTKGALAGKPVATFASTGTQNGGQETTHMTALNNFVHQGMMYVPLGYQAGGIGQFDMEKVHGGSPWGASTHAGADGSRQPPEADCAIAKKQGECFAGTVKTILASVPDRKLKICIIYYSTYGHIRTLATELSEAAKKEGLEVSIFRAPETLSDEILQKMGAPDKGDDPMLDMEVVGKLPEFDGFIFGMPTRFGAVPAQMKAVFDMFGGHWQKGALVGKPVATFVSTGTQNGGQESTHLGAISNFVHLGMIYVPLGYAAGGDGQFNMDEIHGGSAWGSSTLAGADGSRQPSEIEKKIAAKQGETFAQRVKALAK
jgi:NAD(P)H dehydrogenase (quinone)